MQRFRNSTRPRGVQRPRNPGYLAALLLAGLALAGPARAEAERSNTWYAQALTRGEAGLSLTHFWSKGPWLRAETVVAGHKAVTIVRGKTYYAYDELAAQGLAIRREPAAIERQPADRRPFGDEYRILTEQGAEKIRGEDILDRPVGVYRITDESGKRELWVTEDEARIPLRLEIFDRSRGMHSTTEYINWQSDLHIPDAFFEPDPRMELEKMDFEEYLKRSAADGSVGPVPVLFLRFLYTRKDDE